jgi:putative oxidoreductase
MDRLNAWAPRVLSLLRIIAALLFMEHGLMKLFNFPAPVPGMPHPLPLMGMVAGVLETFGGGLVLIGLFTRPVAFLLSGEMAIAYFMVHMKQGPWPALNYGEPAILFCWVFFYLVFAGGGSWSVDARLGRRAEL